jgi:hypothetical protein
MTAQVNPSQTSSNWAGYVASGPNALTVEPTTFSAVSATWVQPTAACGQPSAVGPTSAAFWVGLGGEANGSNALEQTGTEADCTRAGAQYFAWYELVPAASVRLKLEVRPGNTMSASVSVNGEQVAIRVRNLSQGTSSSKTLTMATPDTSSAEWITEAPSVCAAEDQCRPLSLTDFGTVKFSHATAQSGDATASISDSSWTATPIDLRNSETTGGYAGGGRFDPDQSGDEALPSSLTQSGNAFSVTWHKLPSAPSPSGGGSSSPFSI